MEPALIEAAGWLDAVGMRRWASGAPWVYPVANVAHVLGLAMLVGAIGTIDLRLAGLWRRLPLDALSRALTPIAAAGLAVQLASGTVLFAADGAALAASPVFHWKLALIVLALGNVALFRFSWQPRLASAGAKLPAGIRASAILSLSLWLMIAILGRLIAYV